jgi:hypothetical protein
MINDILFFILSIAGVFVGGYMVSVLWKQSDITQLKKEIKEEIHNEIKNGTKQ